MDPSVGHAANATAMFVDETIYGADCQMGSLIAADAKTGNRLWQTFDATDPKQKRRLNHGTAFLTRIGTSNRYFVMSEVGRFHLLEPSGEAFGRNVVWTHPAYANQTAFVRNDTEIVAVDLTADASGSANARAGAGSTSR